MVCAPEESDSDPGDDSHAQLIRHIRNVVLGKRNDLTLREVAGICGLSESHIRTLLKRGEIIEDHMPSPEGGARRKRCVTVDALIEFLGRQETNFLSCILGDPLNGRARHVDEGLDTK